MVNPLAPLFVLISLTTMAVADGSSETAVPKMVMTGPPGTSVCVPTTYSETEVSVKVVPSNGIAGGCGVW